MRKSINKGKYIFSIAFAAFIAALHFNTSDANAALNVESAMNLGGATSFITYENTPAQEDLSRYVPSTGRGYFEYNGTTYYYSNGRIVTYDELCQELEDEKKLECFQNGYLYYSSESEATAYVSSYLNNLPWDDQTGFTLVYKGDSVTNIKNLIKNEHSYSKSYSSFIFGTNFSSSIASSPVIQFITVSIKRSACEVHSQGMTAAQAEAADNVAKSVASRYNTGSTYDKVKNVYYYLCDNIQYDMSYQKGSLYDALVTGNSVCSGYASAFQVIMEKLGVESYIIAGEIDGVGHAWNAVNIDGNYYYVDTTFGDTSGLYSMYMLFGTNLRNDPYSLGIPDHSYGKSSNTSSSIKVTYDDNKQPVIVDSTTGNKVSEETAKEIAEKETLSGQEETNNSTAVVNNTENAESSSEATSESSSETSSETLTQTSTVNSTSDNTSSQNSDSTNSSESEEESNGNENKKILIITIVAVLTLIVSSTVIGLLLFKYKHR